MLATVAIHAARNSRGAGGGVVAVTGADASEEGIAAVPSGSDGPGAGVQPARVATRAAARILTP